MLMLDMGFSSLFEPLILNKIIRRPDRRLSRLDQPEFIMLFDGGIDDRWFSP